MEHAEIIGKYCNTTIKIIEISPNIDEGEDVCILAQIQKISHEEQHHYFHKNIYIYVPGYTTIWCKPGQIIEIKNIVLQQPPIQSSFRNYLIRENVWAVTHMPWLSYTTIQKTHLIQQYFNELCEASVTQAHKQLTTATYALYVSIFCGKKLKCSEMDDLKKTFQYWGLSHYLARSGLHLIILIALLISFLFWIPLSLQCKQWIIVCIISWYYITTYSSVAFVRAFCMYLLYTLCKQLYIATQALHILLVTALVILIYNPYHIFFLDFQLSFGVTCIILWFFQQVENRKTIAS